MKKKYPRRFGYIFYFALFGVLCFSNWVPAFAYDPCGSESPTAQDLMPQISPLSLDAPAQLAGRSSSSVVRRLWGETRYDTMRTISSTGFTRASTVVLACGNNYPDALAAAAFAGANSSPILLTERDNLPGQTADAIQLLGASNVVLLGGEEAISPAVANCLVEMGLHVSRIQGQTREQTAAQIASEVVAQNSSDTIIVANGYSPWDSLSVSPYCYGNGYPVLLTSSNGLLSNETLRSLQGMSSVKKAIIVGGPNAVSDDVVAQLSGLQVQRWWGQTRYETSTAIAEHAVSFGASCAVVGLASGENFPDALTGGALIGVRRGVLLLSSYTGFEPSDYLAKNQDKIGRCYVLGGNAALSTSVEKSAQLLLGDDASRDYSLVPSNKDVLVFAPHQDDEVLSMGVFIERAIENGCRVHVVLCTDGSRSWVRKELANGSTCPFHEGSHNYDLSEDAFVSARDDEFLESCQALGVSLDGICIDATRLRDGNLSIDAAKQIVSKYLDQYPGAVICTTSPLVGLSQHSDHRALGNAALELYREGTIKDLRLFVEPYNLNDFAHNNLGLVLCEANADDDASSLLSACGAYSLWNPTADRYAIGYHSVGGSFDAIAGSGYVAYWHSGASL